MDAESAFLIVCGKRISLLSRPWEVDREERSWRTSPENCRQTDRLESRLLMEAAQKESLLAAYLVSNRGSREGNILICQNGQERKLSQWAKPLERLCWSKNDKEKWTHSGQSSEPDSFHRKRMKLVKSLHWRLNEREAFSRCHFTQKQIIGYDLMAKMNFLAIHKWSFWMFFIEERKGELW